jgi:phosphoglycolate phosphatase-like HAD superfamily hydrolase
MTRTQTLLACLASIFCLMATASAQALPSWNDTPTKTAIISFVEKVTKESSPDFVRPEDRIAVFDNDGTLWTEQPMYTQFAFVIDRVKAMAPDHPEWKDKEPFKSLLAGDAKGVAASGEKGLLELVAATHAGMTTEAFAATVTNWLKTAKHPKFNRSYLECVYQPQIELLQYLRDNGFQTFIVSGGGIDFMRPWTQAIYGIPPDQVVGSSGKTKYEVRDGEPVIVKLPEIDFIDDKAGKPVAIHKFIGKRPILAFGNSDGDFEMLEYVTTGSGPRLGLILHHDDAEREAAYDRESHVGKLARGLDEAQARGWVLVRMKSDWAVVFPRQ